MFEPSMSLQIQFFCSLSFYISDLQMSSISNYSTQGQNDTAREPLRGTGRIPRGRLCGRPWLQTQLHPSISYNTTPDVPHISTASRSKPACGSHWFRLPHSV